jgi:hypothetical protein
MASAFFFLEEKIGPKSERPHEVTLRPLSRCCADIPIKDFQDVLDPLPRESATPP